MQYFTTESLGPKRSLTPEGFLLCAEVPIARTGLQLYGPDETPIQVGAADVVRIERDPEEVFAPEMIASLSGKPVVNEHPLDEFGLRTDITPRNWRDLAIGSVLNPRRGVGLDEDVLIADLLITDQDAIDLIDAGKRELSVGYDADYEEIGPGHGRQTNIRANHVALVEHGRCGPRCSIGDTALVGLTDDACCKICEEEEEMARSQTWRDRVRAAFRSRDQEALENAMGAAPGDDAEEPDDGNGGTEHHVHVHLPGSGETETNIAPPGGNGNGADQGGEDLPPALAARFQQNDAEHEELWDAIESMAGAGAGMPGGDRRHRDARRLRDGIRGRDADPDEDGDTEDARNRDDFPSAPGISGNKTVLPDFAMEAPPGTNQNDARRARDSALFADSFQETVQLAEILVPGIRLPSFDAKAPPKRTFDAICAFRRRVLDAAWQHPETRELIDADTGGRFTTAGALSPDTVRVLYRSVGNAKARANNTRGGNRTVDLVFGGGMPVGGAVRSPGDLQAILDQHYKRPS